MFVPEDHASPNFGPRRGGATPSMIVIHYTGMASAEAAIARLADPASEVSAHYVIGQHGIVVRMVSEEMRAWHAGVACWEGVEDVNSHSIGIELVNPGRELGYPPFPEPQMSALETLLADIFTRRGILPQRVVGHGCISPGRKTDPGEKFDWRRLARRGLSVWLDPDPPDDAPDDAPADARRFQAAARRFGYGAPESGAWCEATCAVWRAFLMRFLPFDVKAAPNGRGIAHLERLAENWPASPVLDPEAASA